MATLEVDHLHEIITDLLTTADPITFYEAFMVTHMVQPIQEPSIATLDLLLQLHDAPHLTDGARDLLAPLLRHHAQRLAAQRQLAARPILRKDSGKTVRAPCGSRLLLRLEERRASMCLWHLVSLSGPAQCTRRLDRADAPTCAEFDVELLQCGVVELQFVEEVSEQIGERAKFNARPRTFELRIVVEAALATQAR